VGLLHVPAARVVVSPMRVPSLLIGTLVAATALTALAPTAAAVVATCTALTDPGCPGAYCHDENGDRVFQSSECTRPKELLDPCAFRSDCCGGLPGPALWCPEDS